MVWATLISVISGILIIVAIILDFVAADQSRKNNNSAAEGWAITAGILSIIGLVGIIIASILSGISSVAESAALGI